MRLFIIILSILFSVTAKSQFVFGGAGTNVLKAYKKTLQFSSNADQTITTTVAQINLTTDDAADATLLTRSGGTFTCVKAGEYLFILQPQITRLAAGNIRFWLQKNSLNVPNSGVLQSFSTNGESTVPTLLYPITLAVGETVRFMSITSTANSYSMDFTAADVNAPATPSVILTILCNN